MVFVEIIVYNIPAKSDFLNRAINIYFMHVFSVVNKLISGSLAKISHKMNESCMLSISFQAINNKTNIKLVIIGFSVLFIFT